MIPLATTTITVFRPIDADLDEEPYSGTETTGLLPSTTGVRAVISSPGGREQTAGGEQVIWDFDLVCDLVDLRRTDSVRDDITGILYRVVWFMTYPGEHVEAGLRLVEGEV